jgi:hypothetical protein
MCNRSYVTRSVRPWRLHQARAWSSRHRHLLHVSNSTPPVPPGAPDHMWSRRHPHRTMKPPLYLGGHRRHPNNNLQTLIRHHISIATTCSYSPRPLPPPLSIIVHLLHQTFNPSVCPSLAIRDQFKSDDLLHQRGRTKGVGRSMQGRV